MSSGGPGGEGEPIYRAAAAAPGAPLPSEPPFAHAGSPSALAPLEGALFWADRGSLYDASGKISARDKRIVSLVGCQRVLFWIEAPYDGAGPHELWAKALTGSPGRVRAGLSPSERELVCAGRFIAWADDDGVQVIASEGGRPFVRAKATGVQNLAYRDGRLWWSEAHGEGDDAVSIFRSVPAEGGEVLRLGRTSGYVSALYVHVAYLYWSGPRGIARAPIPTAEPIH